jgi:hypothetical protein
MSTLSAGMTSETAPAEMILRRWARVRMTNRVVTCGSASRINSSTTPRVAPFVTKPSQFASQ